VSPLEALARRRILGLVPLVLTIDLKNPEPGMVTRAAQVIRAGGLVAFPTETVYGLGADATNADTVRRIFAVKGRPAGDPLIVHVLDVADLKKLSSHVPPMAIRLAEAFWPGPLTLIVPRGRAIPAVVAGGRDTVAVRAPDHPVARALLSAAAVPIAAPSANPFGRTSPTDASHVIADLGDLVDVVIDGGPCTIGIESTIVDCTARLAVVLRPGGVTLEALQAVAPSIRPAREAHERAPRSPGRFRRHYAPAATLLLVSGEDVDIRATLAKAGGELSTLGLRTGILAAREDLPWLGNSGARVVAVALATLRDTSAAAQNLYAVLRNLDAMGVDVILARDFGEKGLGVAVRDRLLRAAEGRSVQIGPRAVDTAVRDIVATVEGALAIR
jgi:L-threonylcarbamoyladenylate synthase